MSDPARLQFENHGLDGIRHEPTVHERDSQPIHDVRILFSKVSFLGS